jgi:hypothetical protein
MAVPHLDHAVVSVDDEGADAVDLRLAGIPAGGGDRGPEGIAAVSRRVAGLQREAPTRSYRARGAKQIRDRTCHTARERCDLRAWTRDDGRNYLGGSQLISRLKSDVAMTWVRPVPSARMT